MKYVNFYWIYSIYYTFVILDVELKQTVFAILISVFNLSANFY